MIYSELTSDAKSMMPIMGYIKKNFIVSEFWKITSSIIEEAIDFNNDRGNAKITFWTYKSKINITLGSADSCKTLQAFSEAPDEHLILP